MIRHPAAEVRRYLLVWLALMIFLALSFWSAYIPLGPFNLVVSLAISVAKMLLVMMFFMHLRQAEPTLRIFAALGFVFLALLAGMTVFDFLSRLPVFVAG